MGPSSIHGAMSGPDPERLGGIAWARRTQGTLSAAERRALFAAIVRGQGEYLAGLLKFATGRTPAGARSLRVDDLAPPDSAFARAAEDACREQPPHVAGHGYRTWMYGSALATLDGIRLDPEQFYVASLLHDYGIAEPVAGQDFTVRSAARIERCAGEVGLDPEVAAAVMDAVTVHATVGVSVAVDGATGVYVQSGAMFDLGGLRVGDLTRAYRNAVIAQHPREGVSAAIIALIAAEARAVPGGRFAQLHRCGLTLVVRANPLRPR